MIIFSALFAVHALLTFKQLDMAASFESLKTYVNYSYLEKLTLLGGFGSAIVGGIAVLLGAMGTIVVFVILLTISIGVLVDYENYGRFEDAKIRKLDSKKQRQKVAESDKETTADGKPVFSYDNSANENSEIVDSVEVDANDLQYSGQNQNDFVNYNQDDVVDEVYDDGGYNYQEDDDTYSPTQSDDELTRSRQDFINNTFNYTSTNYAQDNYEPPNQNPYSFENQSNAFETYNENRNNSFGEQNSFETSSQNEDNGPQIDDNILDILNQDEPEVEIGDTYNGFETNNNFESKDTNSGFDSVSSFDTKPEEPEQKPFANVSNFDNLRQPEPRPFENPTFGGNNFVQPARQPEPPTDWKTRNEGIMTNSKPKVVKEKPVSVGQTAMTGVRYNPPPLSLLAMPQKDDGDYTAEQARKAKQLEDVLEAFKVPAKVVKIVRGPKITRFELSVPRGISVKKIPNYEYDIQSSLAAKTVTIRAPIPGSEFVGIELENDTFTNVTERELLESPEFQNAKGPLTIAVGKDISGEIVVKSLTKLVHALVAGSTGSGKSVFIHNIVLSLVYKNSPEDLRLVMIDPKKVEFNMYNGLPHLVTPTVVSGKEKAVNALNWCVKEMNRRFSLMGKVGFNDISLYNKSELVKSGQLEHFPYIVIIVDELAELMLYNKKETESAIQSLTQLARACGMHMIIAVQRPSVDVITGVIKNNVATRFAFRLQSGIDSKTMLGTIGAEKLLGQGDMILQTSDTSAMPRLQGAYASTPEIKSVVDFIANNNPAEYDDSIQDAFDNGPQTEDTQSAETSFLDTSPARDKVDELFKVAVKTVMMAGVASISYLQRRLSIGYARSAKIVDQMEDRGYVAPATGAKQRKVLITPEQFRADFGEEYNA